MSSVEAEQEVGSGPPRPGAARRGRPELTLTPKPARLQRLNRLLEMREGRVRQAAEIDDVGALAARSGPRPRDNASTSSVGASTISAKMRQSWRGEVAPLAALPKKLR